MAKSDKGDKGDKKKSEQLGMSHGSANHRLRKSILFEFVNRLGYADCFQCGEIIETIEEFSIDHKVPWLDSKDPKKLFFDLENIAFSHIKCNCGAARRLHVIGEKSAVSKLTESQAIEIKQSSEKTKVLSTRFNISDSQIRGIRRGTSWAHLNRR